MHFPSDSNFGLKTSEGLPVHTLINCFPCLNSVISVLVDSTFLNIDRAPICTVKKISTFTLVWGASKGMRYLLLINSAVNQVFCQNFLPVLTILWGGIIIILISITYCSSSLGGEPVHKLAEMIWGIGASTGMQKGKVFLGERKGLFLKFHSVFSLLTWRTEAQILRRKFRGKAGIHHQFLIVIS